MNRLIVIVGPTAVGKSKFAFQLAQRLQGEIISGDSMCIYRGLDIATAKPSLEERQKIRHHLIDIKTPTESFSVVEFQNLATAAISDVNSRGRLPILVGGTGLYIQALLEGFQFSSTPKTTMRDALLTANENGSVEAFQQLQQIDPVSAARIHPNDHKRIIRALEVAATEQQPISQSKWSTSAVALLFDCIVLGLTMDRQRLYQRINSRVDQMIEAGLHKEISTLIGSGFAADSTALQAIGCKELVACIQGSMTLDDAARQIKQSSRRYAKRQMTWFKRMPYIQWIDQQTDTSDQQILEIITRQVAEKFAIK